MAAQSLRASKGVATVELAVLLPLIMVVLASITDLWRFVQVHEEAQNVASLIGRVLSRDHDIDFCDLPVLLRYTDLAPVVMQDDDPDANEEDDPTDSGTGEDEDTVGAGQARQPANYRIFVSLLRGTEEGGARFFTIANQSSYGMLNAESALGDEGAQLALSDLNVPLRELLSDFLVTLVAVEVWIDVRPFIMPGIVEVASSGPFYHVFRGSTRGVFERGRGSLNVVERETCES